MNDKLYFYKHGYNGEIRVAKNQKVIQINKVQNGINFDANKKALATLTTDAYALYMYILTNDPKRPWALSSKDVTNKTALSMRTYNNAVAELIDKGYLVAGEINLNNMHFDENSYHLYEDPDLITKRDKVNNAYNET